jgi:hypothetical protein
MGETCSIESDRQMPSIFQVQISRKDMDERVILELVFSKWNVSIQNGSVWFRRLFIDGHM